MQIKYNKNTFLKPYVLLLYTIFLPVNISGKTTVFFSPDEKPTEQLIKHINKVQKRIYVAIYMLTDVKIAHALINAKEKRNISVQVVTDQISLNSEYGKIKLLKEHNIEIFVFQPKFQNKYSQPIMHNKFAILDNKVWTGSFNWTISANKHNQENVIITDEKAVCERYLTHFEKLKKRSLKTKVMAVTQKTFFQTLKERSIELLTLIRNKTNN